MNWQRYLRRAPSAVELDDQIDPVYDEISTSTRAFDRGSYRGPELDKNQIILDADEFVTKYDLDDIRDLVRKGALLFHDPEDLARIEDLTREELVVLYGQTADTTVLKKSSLECYMCFLAAVLCACLQHVYFNLSPDYPIARVSIWPKCAPWFGALLGCIFTVPLNRLLGRRKAICVAAALALGVALGKALLPHWNSVKAMIAVYWIAGTATGILTCTVPLYLAETSVASLRGARVAFWPIAIILTNATISTYGMIYPAFSLDLAFYMTLFAALLIMSLIIANITPESPYWCVSNKKMQQAFDALYHFRKARITAACDLYRMYYAGVHSAQGGEGSSRHPQLTTPGITMLVTNPQLRRMIVASCAIILTRNLSAIEFLRISCYPRTAPELAPLIIEAVLSLATLIPMILCATWADKFGRRPLLMVLTLLMFTTREITTRENSAVYSCGAQVLCLIFYRTTEAIYTIFVAEGFLIQYNDIGMAIAMAVNYGSLIMVSFGLTSLSRARRWPTGHELSAPLFVSLLLVWLIMRETKKVPLEDVDSVFRVPTRNLVLYRVRVHLPYLFKRYVLWRDVHFESLEDSRYSFAAITLDDAEALSVSHED